MKSCVQVGYRIVFLLSALVLSFSSCNAKKSIQSTSAKIVEAELQELASHSNGSLAIAGSGEDKMHVLFLWGTAQEMGRAAGELMKKEISQSLPNILLKMTAGLEGNTNPFEQIYQQAQPFIPEHFLQEIQGIAEGSGLSENDVLHANLIGEATEFHCSLYGAWGKATRADGHLYQLRCLDYATEANIQQFPVMVIYVPENGQVFANLTWAGVVGCISGISEQRLAISEIGDDYNKEADTYAGMPFMFLLRDVLQFDATLDQAIDRICHAPRTSSLMYGVGDGKLGQLRGFQTSHTLCNVFAPDNLEPVTATHQRIEDVVYWGMSWDVPRYDGPLHDKLMQHYGRINAENTITDILPSVGTGNLQAVVYDLTAMKLWIANARADDETGPLPAYQRQYLKFDMNEVFKQARRLAGKRN